MSVAHLVLGVGSCALFAAAGGWGAWRWWRVEPSELFWRLLRCAQVLLTVEVASGGVLVLLGRGTGGSLHLVYGLLPLAVSFVGEQLRVAAAETVLAARGHESAEAVGRLEPAAQRSVVLAIVRRELGVMSAAALVCFGLLVRASFTGGAP